MDDQELAYKCNVDEKDSPRERMIVELVFTSSPALVETRFPRVQFVVEQGLPFGVTAAEQELPLPASTVGYGLLPSRVSSSMDEDTQCLEGGEGLSPGSPASRIDSNTTGTQESRT